MDDFLYSLKVQLMNRLMPAQVDEQMVLYQNYIQEQLAGGRTLDQIFRELGDPEKLAELIAQDYEDKFHEKRQQEQERMLESMGMGSIFGAQLSEEELNAQVTNPEHGFQAEYDEKHGWKVHAGKSKFNLNSWYGRLLILVAILAIYILAKELGN